MVAVKNKDSKIELTLRKILWDNGYRYRKNYSKVYGKPDIVFIGKRWQSSVTANFGMATLGMKIKIKFIQTKNSGQEKSRETSKEMKKLIKNLKMTDGRC